MSGEHHKKFTEGETVPQRKKGAGFKSVVTSKVKTEGARKVTMETGCPESAEERLRGGNKKKKKKIPK